MRGWEKKETHRGFDLREPVKEFNEIVKNEKQWGGFPNLNIAR